MNLFFEGQDRELLIRSVKQKLKKLQDIQSQIKQPTERHEVGIAIECGKKLLDDMELVNIPKEIAATVKFVSVGIEQLNGFYLQYHNVKQQQQHEVGTQHDHRRKRQGLSSEHPRT